MQCGDPKRAPSQVAPRPASTADVAQMSEAKWKASVARAGDPVRRATARSCRDRQKSTAIEVASTSTGQTSGADPPRGRRCAGRFEDDPRAGDGHKACLAKGGEILDLAVAVGVIFVGRLVAHVD